MGIFKSTLKSYNTTNIINLVLSSNVKLNIKNVNIKSNIINPNIEKIQYNVTLSN